MKRLIAVLMLLLGGRMVFADCVMREPAGDCVNGTIVWTPKCPAGQYVVRTGPEVNVCEPAGGGTMGQATVDFGAGSEAAIVTVSDAGVTTSSIIVASVAYVATVDHDIDEVGAETLFARAGNIVNGVSFDVLVTVGEGLANGTFKITYTRN